MVWCHLCHISLVKANCKDSLGQGVGKWISHLNREGTDMYRDWRHFGDHLCRQPTTLPQERIGVEVRWPEFKSHLLPCLLRDLGQFMRPPSHGFPLYKTPPPGFMKPCMAKHRANDSLLWRGRNFSGHPKAPLLPWLIRSPYCFWTWNYTFFFFSFEMPSFLLGCHDF